MLVTEPGNLRELDLLTAIAGEAAGKGERLLAELKKRVQQSSDAAAEAAKNQKDDA